MITEEGVIEDTSGAKAVVRIRRSSACAHCDSRGACKVISDRDMMVEVDNGVGAQKGDRVEISVPARSLLKLSLLVYFLPIVALVGGAYAGSEFIGPLGPGPTFGAIMVGGGAMALAFYLLRGFDKRAGSGMSYSPRINRILKSLDAKAETHRQAPGITDH